jgi:hypothetical protein
MGLGGLSTALSAWMQAIQQAHGAVMQPKYWQARQQYQLVIRS